MHAHKHYGLQDQSMAYQAGYSSAATRMAGFGMSLSQHELQTSPELEWDVESIDTQ